MMRHRFRHYLEYFFVRVVSSWIRSRSLPEALDTHRILGRLWCDYIKYRRKETLENLRRAFPERTEAEIDSMARATFFHFSRFVVEQVLLSKMIRFGLHRFTGNSNWEVMESALSEGRGVVLIVGHHGNWELAGTAIAMRGLPLWVLVAEVRNKLVDRIVYKHRIESGMSVIRIKDSRRKIPQVLKKGEIIGLLSDQNAGKNGIFVPFFGRPASTHTGAAVYALRYRAPLVYLMSYYQDGKYHFYFERFPDNPMPKFSRENVYRMTEWYVNLLERDVRKFPEQYLWMHRRWKTAPPELEKVA